MSRNPSLSLRRHSIVPLPSRWRAVLLLLFLAALAPVVAHAQQHRLLQTDHPAYVYIQRLQRGGHLLALHPTALPYTEGDVRSAVAALPDDALSPSEQRWAEMLERLLGPPQPEERALAGARLEGGMQLFNAARPDAMRPLADTLTAWSNASLQGYLEHGPWIAQVGLRHDLAYRYHPDALDAARRLVARSTGAYLGFDARFASVYLGRYRHQWGAIDQPAVLLSDNAFAFDHLFLRLGGDRLALRSIAGELDNLSPSGRFTGEGYRTGSTRRYLTAHRIDWRPSRRLALTFMESVVYSAHNAGLSLKYASPVHTLAFVVANPPRNEEDNGFLAGMLWFYAGGLTLHGQLLIDDFDVINGVEPASAAFTGTATYRLPRRAIDLSLGTTVVTARAYNAFQPDGKYVYMRQGLALAHNDFVRVTAQADAYLDAWLPGLALAPRLDVLWQGETHLLDPFPPSNDAVGTILHGIVERTVRPAVSLFYQPAPWIWLKTEAGWNVTRDARHVDGATTSRFVGLLQFGFRLRLDRPVRLTL